MLDCARREPMSQDRQPPLSSLTCTHQQSTTQARAGSCRGLTLSVPGTQPPGCAPERVSSMRRATVPERRIKDGGEDSLLRNRSLPADTVLSSRMVRRPIEPDAIDTWIRSVKPNPRTCGCPSTQIAGLVALQKQFARDFDAQGWAVSPVVGRPPRQR